VAERRKILTKSLKKERSKITYKKLCLCLVKKIYKISSKMSVKSIAAKIFAQKYIRKLKLGHNPLFASRLF
jgi:hypothetical protein